MDHMRSITNVGLCESTGFANSPQEILGMPKQIGSVRVIPIKFPEGDMWSSKVPEVNPWIFFVVRRDHLARLPIPGILIRGRRAPSHIEDGLGCPELESRLLSPLSSRGKVPDFDLPVCAATDDMLSIRVPIY
jgi:hypothetical protein